MVEVRKHDIFPDKQRHLMRAPSAACNAMRALFVCLLPPPLPLNVRCPPDAVLPIRYVASAPRALRDAFHAKPCAPTTSITVHLPPRPAPHEADHSAASPHRRRVCVTRQTAPAQAYYTPLMMPLYSAVAIPFDAHVMPPLFFILPPYFRYFTISAILFRVMPLIFRQLFLHADYATTLPLTYAIFDISYYFQTPFSFA